MTRRTARREPGPAAAAADLLLGAVCPCCGEASRAVCARCLPSLRPAPRVVGDRPVRVVAAGDHAGPLQLAVVAWKERPSLSLTPTLGHLLAVSVCQVLGPEQRVTLVPVPSSRRSRRTRGADVVALLARAASTRLREVGVDATVRAAVRMRRQTRDQSGLGARERAANLAGAFEAVPVRGLHGAAVVLVDDVVTTGVTLAEAARALRTVDVTVRGAATVSARA